MKSIEVEKLKAEIIVNVMNSKKTKALKELEIFAKTYKILLKKSKKVEKLEVSLKAFILNTEGYNVTIGGLYNSLLAK